MRNGASWRAAAAAWVVVAMGTQTVRAQSPLVGEEIGVGAVAYAPVQGEIGAPQVAFDGTVFLAVWSDPRHAIYGARFDREGRRLDSAGIRLGDGLPWSSAIEQRPSVSSNGDGFLVAWQTSSGIRARRVDGEGRSMDSEPHAFEGMAPELAFDGEEYVLASVVDGELVIRRLDADLSVRASQRMMRDLSRDNPRYAIAATGQRLLVVWSRDEALHPGGELFAQLFDPQARALWSEPKVIAQAIEDVRLASDAQAFFACARRSDGGSVALQIRAENGFIEAEGNFCAPISSDGSFLYHVSSWDPSSLQRRTRSFAMVGLAPLMTGIEWSLPSANAEGVLMLGSDASGLWSQFVASDLSSRAATLVSTQARPQYAPALSHDGGTHLLAYAQASTITAVEVDADGSLASEPMVLTDAFPPIATAGMRGRSLIVFHRNGELHGLRVEGDAREELVFGAIDDGVQPSVVADESGFLVVSVADSQLEAQRVTSDGLVESSTILAPADGRQTALASVDGEQVFVTWSFQGTLEGMLLDRDGSPSGAPIEISENGEASRVASDGARVVAAWRQGGRLLARCFDPRRAEAESTMSIGDAVSSFALAWIGDRYLVVWAQNELFGQHFDSSCAPIDGVFSISTLDRDEGNPTLSVGDDVLVAYERWVDGEENSRRLRVRTLRYEHDAELPCADYRAVVQVNGELRVSEAQAAPMPMRCASTPGRHASSLVWVLFALALIARRRARC